MTESAFVLSLEYIMDYYVAPDYRSYHRSI